MAQNYIDINVNYTPEQGSNAYITQMKVIVQNLERLLNTRPGTVPFNRSYGSSLWSLLFENGDALSLYQVELLVYQDITLWEPNIEISPYGITINRIDPNTYQIDLVFTVPSLGDAVGTLSQTITDK